MRRSWLLALVVLVAVCAAGCAGPSLFVPASDQTPPPPRQTTTPPASAGPVLKCENKRANRRIDWLALAQAGGPDGSRTRDLWLDRPVCLPTTPRAHCAGHNRLYTTAGFRQIERV